MRGRKFLVSVIGGHKCARSECALAEEAGKVIAREGAVLVTGGLTGIMECASKGARSEKGLVIGIVPGDNKDDANPYADIVITSGMGFARNTLVAGTADMIVAFPGEYGTLSEIGFALSMGKDVYGFGTWDIPDVKNINSIDELREIIARSIIKSNGSGIKGPGDTD